MRFLRHVAGYTRGDEISDITTRSELQIFNINDKIKSNKKEWNDNVSGWTLIEQSAWQLNIDPQNIETSDALREDGKMTSVDSCMTGTDLIVYRDVDGDDVDDGE
jgi:hypothetical protein